MSNDHQGNGHARQPEDSAVERLPADLQAIYDHLARDGEGWARRLPEASTLQGYALALADGTATVDADASADGGAQGPWESDNLRDTEPMTFGAERLAPTTHLRPSRRAVWAGTISAVAIVALLASVFALFPHLRGASSLTTTTATATPQTPSCAPDQISATLPPYTRLFQIAMTSTTEGWAIGDTLNPSDWTANPDPLLVRFDQCRWEPVPDPLPGVTARLESISMDTADDGWAAGTEGTGNSQRCLLLHYTGGQWQRAPLPSALPNDRSACNTIAMRSPEEGWMLATWGYSQSIQIPSHLFHYTDGAWAVVDMPIAQTYAVSIIGPDDVWVAGMRFPAANDPNRSDRVDVAHYQRGQWTTFHFSIGAEAWLRMNSPSDGWLTSGSLPEQVLHYDGASWQPSAFSDHSPSTAGALDVLDSNDAWAFITTPEGAVTSIQHYVGGQWQDVPWPSPEVGIFPPLTRVAPSEYWAIGVHIYNSKNPDLSDSKSVLLHYVDGVWREYGA